MTCNSLRHCAHNALCLHIHSPWALVLRWGTHLTPWLPTCYGPLPFCWLRHVVFGQPVPLSPSHAGPCQVLFFVEPIDSCAARNRRWRALAFLPLLTSSLWTKIGISSIFNFRRRKWSFQQCLVHSDRPIGALNMHKNAQKVERKTRSEISCHYT